MVKSGRQHFMGHAYGEWRTTGIAVAEYETDYGPRLWSPVDWLNGIGRFSNIVWRVAVLDPVYSCFMVIKNKWPYVSHLARSSNTPPTSPPARPCTQPYTVCYYYYFRLSKIHSKACYESWSMRNPPFATLPSLCPLRLFSYSCFGLRTSP